VIKQVIKWLYLPFLGSYGGEWRASHDGRDPGRGKTRWQWPPFGEDGFWPHV